MLVIDTVAIPTTTPRWLGSSSWFRGQQWRIWPGADVGLSVTWQTYSNGKCYHVTTEASNGYDFKVSPLEGLHNGTQRSSRTISAWSVSCALYLTVHSKLGIEPTTPTDIAPSCPQKSLQTTSKDSTSSHCWRESTRNGEQCAWVRNDLQLPRGQLCLVLIFSCLRRRDIQDSWFCLRFRGCSACVSMGIRIYSACVSSISFLLPNMWCSNGCKKFWVTIDHRSKHQSYIITGTWFRLGLNLVGYRAMLIDSFTVQDR